MKILIILMRLKGGVGGSNSNIAKLMKEKGHEVDILSREDDLKIFSMLKSIFPLRKRIRRLMRNKDYDIIYTQDYSMAFPLLFPIPLFFGKHVCCFCGMKRKGFQKFLQNVVGIVMGKRLVGVSDELKKRFKRLTLIYRGTNFEEFKPLNKKRDSIGWVDRTYEMINEDELKKISQSSGLKLRIAKNLSPDKMNEFYNRCKVFVSLPKTGGYNNVWAESMSAGVPVVIGNDRGPGKSFPFDKVLEGESKIRKIEKIIKSPKKIDYRQWLIRSGFSWDEKVKEVESFLRKNINKNG